MQETAVSKHGTKRMRQRCGVTKQAAARMAQKAYQKGTDHKDVNGRLRRWIDGYIDLTDGKLVKLYNGKAYLFGKNKVLITVLDVPGNLHRQLDAQTKHRS